MGRSKLLLAFLLITISFLASLSMVNAEPAQQSAYLWAYSDDDPVYDPSNRLDTDSNAGASWVVYNENIIYIRISDISASTGLVVDDWIEVTVSASPHTATLGTFQLRSITSGDGSGIGVGFADQIIDWEVGIFDDGDVELPWCTTLTVKFKEASGENQPGTGANNVADGNLIYGRHLHVVPEYLYGGLGAIAACFVGLVVFKGRKRIFASLKN